MGVTQKHATSTVAGETFHTRPVGAIWILNRAWNQLLSKTDNKRYRLWIKLWEAAKPIRRIARRISYDRFHFAPRASSTTRGHVVTSDFMDSLQNKLGVRRSTLMRTISFCVLVAVIMGLHRKTPGSKDISTNPTNQGFSLSHRTITTKDQPSTLLQFAVLGDINSLQILPSTCPWVDTPSSCRRQAVARYAARPDVALQYVSFQEQIDSLHGCADKRPNSYSRDNTWELRITTCTPTPSMKHARDCLAPRLLAAKNAA